LVAAAATALTLVVVLLPSESSPSERNAAPAAPQAGSQKQSAADNETAATSAARPRLSTRDRSAIESTLNRFVGAALERTDPGTAWDLAGPDLRGSSTRADWIAGKIPVFPFPASSVPAGSWHPETVTRNSVSFDVLLQPRKGSKVGATTFSVQLLRKGRGWIINRWYPIATFTPIGERPHVVGPNDFTPPAGSPASTNSARLNSVWLIIPAVVVGGALIVIIFLSLRTWLGTRRARRELAASGASTLPPLPSSFTSKRGQ
jgi:hypothetical protein